jgi:hypothetical protein
MISTITTSTVSTVATAGIASSVAIIGVLVLLVLLIQKEIASSLHEPWLKRLNLALNISIAPLLFAFVLLVGIRVSQVLH